MDYGISQVFYKCFTVIQIGTCEIYGKKPGWETDQQPWLSPVKNRKNSGNPIVYCKYPDSHDRVFPDGRGTTSGPSPHPAITVPTRPTRHQKVHDQFSLAGEVTNDRWVGPIPTVHVRVSCHVSVLAI
jgi:hypothetical protein